MRPYILLFFAFAMTALPGYSQYEESSGTNGIYGYTSIDYDPDSNTITAYSETDLDSYLLPYYVASVEVQVQDAQGNWQNGSQSFSGDDASYAETMQFTAAPGQTYNAYGYHSAAFTQQQCADYNCDYYYYWDPWYFYAFEYMDLSDYGSLDFFGPGPDSTVDSSGVDLGETYDSASVSTPAACGDVRDLLIREYRTFNSPYHPVCNDFAWVVYWNAIYGGVNSYFGWLDFVQGQSTGYPDIAVAQPYAYIDGLNKIGNVVVPRGLNYNLTSGYRNPAVEKAVTQRLNLPFFPDSRHLAGDAADIKVKYDTGSIYNNMMQAAEDAHTQACIETGDPDHVHVDWRNKTGPANNWNGTNAFPNPTADASHPNGCPHGWLYY